ncbi:uncharacterized protein LOC127834048 [Dreissena polymorpha]|uniref:NACHT domain-containing protein n=1 Tax=Dreissena polymorpha TaxID=45954 RepID=A0A9D4G705_DREPO|nr:uncharacterized protein LOC127834048 [Dreissena polymorpha]XP_052215576.1 uncharacterized protein LOC127834048 [Dreissena polymorpha]XP_052215577.1 uncharacterized protein LOC127834048 [Dreissena polymorpha]KAH3808667.1 hypothetical protein DPMN_137024 [Dreissena polymorpha]
MASLTDVFTEKERTNWLKAWLAVDIAKSGLEHFVDKEAQIVHADIYKVVTSRFGTANINQVRDEIKKRHRYGNGSWNNASEKQWSSHAWEIAKCYFPPDGYSGNMSAHDTDFNGIINFMLNCLHFDSKFSFPITTGKQTTQAQCPLYKAREIVKAVRHSSQMKVTDADLQCYFTTLNDLLSDSRSLGADSGAQNAVVKLAQLEKDVLRLTTEEMIHFLKAVDTTLKQNLTDVADTSMTELRECRDLCLKKIEDYLETCKQDLSKQADMHKHDIDAHVNIHKSGIDDHTDKCKQDIDKHADKRIRVYNEQFSNFPFTETAYKHGCTEMLRLLTTFYKKALNYIITSPLNECIREKLGDIYMPPKVQLMTGNKWSFQKTGVHITKYKNMILTDGKLNEKIFIQGEAGTGKSTFIAKLAIDWCCITTQVTEQLQSDTITIADTATPTKGSTFFQDLKTLQLFKFVIVIKLRNSVKQLEISKMIKTQLIDLMYSSEEDREKANKLLNEIMKRERCLILLDGLDEWTDPGGGYLPTLAECHNQCIMLFTTRPWKLAEGKVFHSDINVLVNLDGVNEPMKLSKNIMSCIIDRNELENKYAEFKRYVREHNLNNLLLSPMMLSVIVCAFAEGMATKGSKCKLYCVLLESLLKKASSETRKFQDPPFPCFAETQYIQPNIEHVNRLAEAAFHLLFSNKRENSLVFGIEELQTYLGEEHIDVALKSGILSAINQASLLRSCPHFGSSIKAYKNS